MLSKDLLHRNICQYLATLPSALDSPNTQELALTDFGSLIVSPPLILILLSASSSIIQLPLACHWLQHEDVIKRS